MAYDYGAKEPEKLKIKDMTSKQKELLIESEDILYVTMDASYTHTQMVEHILVVLLLDQYPVGDLKQTKFNGRQCSIVIEMKKMRLNMLDDKKSRECTKCYDQEKSGFFSLRLSSNKHFGHNIGMVDNTAWRWVSRLYV